jgi:hypothetical protein
MARETGNTARTMAAAPLQTMQAAIETAVIAQKLDEQARTLAPVKLPFELVAFKLNGKAKDYPSDDDPTVISRKVAIAQVRLANSGITFKANVYRTRYTAIKNDAGLIKVTTRVTLPTTGKGFPMAVFETDDSREQRAIDEFRAKLAADFKVWLAALEGGKAAVNAKGTNHADEIVDFE